MQWTGSSFQFIGSADVGLLADVEDGPVGSAVTKSPASAMPPKTAAAMMLRRAKLRAEWEAAIDRISEWAEGRDPGVMISEFEMIMGSESLSGLKTPP